GVSRDKASSLIRSSLVSLDQKCVTSASQKIDIGGVFSVRGYGKFQLVSCRDTKKGRINIVIKKYL
nr:RNA-binding protein [Ruminococcus sp.]